MNGSLKTLESFQSWNLLNLRSHLLFWMTVNVGFLGRRREQTFLLHSDCFDLCLIQIFHPTHTHTLSFLLSSSRQVNIHPSRKLKNNFPSSSLSL